MPLDRLNPALAAEIEALETEGRAKAPERVITGYVPPSGDRGPRYRLAGSELEFIRMNSNSYLSLSNHAELIRAADEAGHRYGVGPGAVRFIDGTFGPHADLERTIAEFVGHPAARIFNSAYTTTLGVGLTLTTPRTYWIGDALNHNCIIRAMRIANVPRETPGDSSGTTTSSDLEECHLRNVPDGIERVVVIFDGIFSMRGDNAPLDRDRDGRAQPIDDRFTGRRDHSSWTTRTAIGAYGASAAGERRSILLRPGGRVRPGRSARHSESTVGSSPASEELD